MQIRDFRISNYETSHFLFYVQPISGIRKTCITCISVLIKNFTVIIIKKKTVSEGLKSLCMLFEGSLTYFVRYWKTRNKD